MGRKSSIDRLDPEIKAYLLAMIATGSMTLNELIADLQERFPIQGEEQGIPGRCMVRQGGSFRQGNHRKPYLVIFDKGCANLKS